MSYKDGLDLAKVSGSGSKMRKKTTRPKTTGAQSISSLDSGVSAGARTADLNDDALSVTTVGTAADSGVGIGLDDNLDVSSTIDENTASLSPLAEKEQIVIVSCQPESREDDTSEEVAEEQSTHTSKGEVEMERVDESGEEEPEEENEDEINLDIGLDELSEMYKTPEIDVPIFGGNYVYADGDEAEEVIPLEDEEELNENDFEDEEEEEKVISRVRVACDEDLVILPSDKQWRTKNYFILVEKQRQLGSTPMASAKDFAAVSPWLQDPRQTPPPAHWLPLSRRPPPPPPQLSTASSLAMGQAIALIQPSGQDLAKAGSLLQRGISQVAFDDEAEMRRVLELIYDAYRYSSILERALLESRFYHRFPELCSSRELLWLFLLDLHRRRYRQRPPEQAERLEQVGLTTADDALWTARVDAAAALSGLRVRNGALRLSELLPSRLRDGRQPRQQDALITGWVNVFRTRTSDAINRLERQGLVLGREPAGSTAGILRTKQARQSGTASVSNDEFRRDPVLPFVLLLPPEQRPELNASGLLDPDRPLFVVQDRAFCLGPALVARVVADYDLRGDVAQTHVATPRATAYLAAALAANPRVGRIIAFGAGRRCKQYRAYLKRLGVRNTCILAQSWSEAHDTPLIANVVAVLATPPNSCSSVNDPVDLACSRGGDLGLLRRFTGIERDPGAGESPVIPEDDLIAEQAETLRYAMGKPHIQVVVYETHSNRRAENGALVTHLVKMMNEDALDRHYEVTKRAAWIAAVAAAAAEQRRIEPGDVPPPKRETVEVPDCDLFEVAQLPDICPAKDSCLILKDQGCYLALIQRKEVVRMDANYMIRMAEIRGLFGSPTHSRPSHAERARRRKEQEAEEARALAVGAGGDHRRGVFCLERISAPTRAWLERILGANESCPRFMSHWSRSLRCRLIRLWWREAARAMSELSGQTPRMRLGHIRRRRKTMPLCLCSLQLVDSWRQ